MDESTLVMIIIFSCLALLVVVLMLEPAYAIRNMELTYWTINERPIICIDEIKNNKWSIMKAVHEWNAFTNDTKWKIKVSENYCNIKVYESQVLLIDNKTAWGGAYCVTDCWIKLIMSNNTVNKVRTSSHEIGHILSLGHWPVPESAHEWFEIGACHDSVMWSSGGCGYPVFYKGLLDALECRHYIDGFGGVFNPHCKSIELAYP